AKRLALWKEHVDAKVNWELFDRGVETFTWVAMAEIARLGTKRNLLEAAIQGTEYAQILSRAFSREPLASAGPPLARGSRLKLRTSPGQDPLVSLRQELEKPFAASVFLWRRTGGPKGDLLQEIDTVVQVPGWSNIWTQPIANRIDMLSTGVRTQIG